VSNEKSNWLVSSSPHLHSRDSVPKIMLTVVLALMPAMAASIYFFGWNAIRLTLVCVVSCVAFEFIARRLMRRNAGIDDFSAVVTGLLLAFNLPPSLPSWMAVVGCFAAIVITKQLYGGIGYNIFNPALIGRAVLLIAFPVAMTTWLTPGQGFFPGADAITTATPLGFWKTACRQGPLDPQFFHNFPIMSLLTGNRPGCIGETPALALLLGGGILLWRRCIYWYTPLAYIATVSVSAAILHFADPASNLPVPYHLLTGGLILGAFFMATDMVTTPTTKSGLLIFGVGCGILTMLIRKWGGYPEGVSFSILIMNALTPLIDRATRPNVFGRRKTAPA
jgi:electron transport complex protein RnfD